MPFASSFAEQSFCTHPDFGRVVDTRSVELGQAAGLIRNFLIAIEAEGGARAPFMEFAQRRAEWQLKQWGDPLREGGAA